MRIKQNRIKKQKFWPTDPTACKTFFVWFFTLWLKFKKNIYQPIKHMVFLFIFYFFAALLVILKNIYIYNIHKHD